MPIPLGNSLRSRVKLQVQSLIFNSLLSFLSTEKAYSSFPRLNNLALTLIVNTLLLHGLNPRPSLYDISAKNHLNCLKNLWLESLFSLSFRRHFWLWQYFWSAAFNYYVFHHSNFPDIMSPGITVKSSG